MEIHIIYEHIEREIYPSFLIKFELEKRGHNVKIFRMQEPHLPFFNAPDLIIMPWFNNNSQIDNLKVGYIRRIKKILNLQYEQVTSQLWLDIDFHTPSGLTKNGYHLCWGNKRKEYLMANGVSESHLRVIGDIRQDFSKEEFQSFYKTKQELSEEFKLPLNHKWHLFISSFAFSNPNEHMKKDTAYFIGQNNTEIWQKINLKSQKMILKWIEQFIIEYPDHEFIYRPHPSEFKASDYSAPLNLAKKYPNFHLIFNYSVQDWILNCDFINTWFSTSIVECFKLGKVCNILRPFKIDEYYDVPYYITANKIKDYNSFKNVNIVENNEFPICIDQIKEYYDDIDSDEFIYKKVCDYIEDLIMDINSKNEFYYYNPIIDNLIFILRKFINFRIHAIIKNMFHNRIDNELNNVMNYDKEKINKIKQIVDENFNHESCH